MYSKIITVVAVAAIAVSIWQFTLKPIPTADIAQELRDVSVDYRYLNVSKVLDIGKHYIVDFSGLRDELREIAGAYPPESTFVYFSYLNNGSWIGINERAEFTAASLVKVPLAMATYKAIEAKQLSLDVKYALAEENLDANFGELYKVGAGKTYSLRELLSIMLRESDNTAKSAVDSIFTNIGVSDPLQDVYANLGWEFLPGLVGDQDGIEDPNYSKISLKVLSNMFLALYNASYVNVEHSQEVLNHLANTDFDEKIAAGVPPGIEISHKIGIGGFEDTYSDCGIVYAPGRNYLLCVGSHGLPEVEANKFMAEISKAAYAYVITN